MKLTNNDRGLAVFHKKLGVIIVDGILADGRVSCNRGLVVTDAKSLRSVNDKILKSSGITREYITGINAHI